MGENGGEGLEGQARVPQTGMFDKGRRPEFNSPQGGGGSAAPDQGKVPPDKKTSEKSQAGQVEEVVGPFEYGAAAALAGLAIGKEAVKAVVEVLSDKGNKELREAIANDIYKDRPYDRIREMLNSGYDRDKVLSRQQMLDLRKSRALRYELAAQLGLFENVDEQIENELRESDWTNYYQNINRFAREKERQAQSQYKYRDNPYISGVVVDVLNDVNLLVHKEGLEHIMPINGQERNPANPEIRDRLGKTVDDYELAKKQAAYQVLFYPSAAENLAELVSQETTAKRTAREANEERTRKEKELADQRRHEEVLAQARSGGSETGPLGMSRGVRRVDARESLIPEAEHIFDRDFLAAHGLPEKIIVPPFLKGFGVEEVFDTRYLLKQAYEKGTLPKELSESNIANSFMELLAEARGISMNELTRVEIEQINLISNKAFKELDEGLVPLMAVRLFDGGTFSSTAGVPKATTDQKLASGALIRAGFDLKDTFAAFSKDAKSKQAISTWMALFGERVGGLDAQSITFVEKYQDEIKGMMAKDQKQLTRDKAVARLNEIANDMSVSLGIDKGRVDLMREMANLLVPGPDVQAYRKLINTHKVLLRDPQELAARPILEKIFYGGKPRELSNALGNSVDSLFTAVSSLDGGNLQIYHKGMKDLLEDMDDIEKLTKAEGEGAGSGKRADREKAIAEKVAGMRSGDIPRINQRTANAIIALPVVAGPGEIIKAQTRTSPWYSFLLPPEWWEAGEVLMNKLNWWEGTKKLIKRLRE